MANAPLLYIPGHGTGNASAAQRREARLRAANDHLLSVIAVLVVQMGGSALVPAASLARQYDFGWKQDPDTGDVLYAAKAAEPEENPAKPEEEPT